MKNHNKFFLVNYMNPILCDLVIWVLPKISFQRIYDLFSATQAELKLSLLMTKGQLEVEVICARGIQGELPGNSEFNNISKSFKIVISLEVLSKK